jgi:tyrosyl-tRNA synthetase
VKERLSSPAGIDVASFLYQAVQAYDFYYLHKHSDVQLQVGGSDQWGNITAGLDLIDKLSPEPQSIPSHRHPYKSDKLGQQKPLD